MADDSFGGGHDEYDGYDYDAEDFEDAIWVGLASCFALQRTVARSFCARGVDSASVQVASHSFLYITTRERRRKSSGGLGGGQVIGGWGTCANGTLRLVLIVLA